MQLLEYVPVRRSTVARFFWLGMDEGLHRVTAVLDHSPRGMKVVLRTDTLWLLERVPWPLQMCQSHVKVHITMCMFGWLPGLGTCLSGSTNCVYNVYWLHHNECYIGSLNLHVRGNFDFCLTVFGGDNNYTYVLSCTPITGFKMKLNLLVRRSYYNRL